MLTGSIADDIKHQFRYGNMVMKLIFVNAGVFLFFGIFYLISFVFQNDTLYHLVLAKVEMPASLRTLLYQPWSLFTYMFLHTAPFHVLSNMLWFYWFGEIFVLYLGDKKVVPLYIIGGVSGALTYLVCYNLLPAFKPYVDVSLMLGASASVFAIVFAAATINPEHQFNLILFGPVRIKYLAVVPLVFDILNIPYGNAGGYIAHLGGALSGYFFVKALQSGFRFPEIKNPFSRQSKVKMAYKNTEYRQSADKSVTKSEQQRVDEILDKIARSGYDSLSKEEKDFLFNYSKK